MDQRLALDGNLTALHEFTTDRAALLKSASTIFTGPGVDFTRASEALLSASPNQFTVLGNGSPSASGGGAVLAVTGGEVDPRAITDAEIGSSPALDRMRGDQANQRRMFTNIEGKKSLDELNLLINQLATLPGRKTVLFYSTGIVNAGEPDRFTALLKKANKGGVTFYTVDVNGLTENPNDLAGVNQLEHAVATSRSRDTSAAGQMESMRHDDYLEQAVQSSNPQAPMRALSEGTGGFAIANTNNYKKMYARITEDLDTHYEALYRPSLETYDGHLRLIEVKTDHPDWTVASRGGYFAFPSGENYSHLSATDMIALAALSKKEAPHAFDFGSTALAYAPTASGSQMAIAVELHAKTLTAAPEPGAKQYRMHVAVLELVHNAEGEVVAKFSDDAPLELPAAKLSTMETGTLNFSHALELPPGHYTVDVVAADVEGHKASVNTFPLETAERKQIAISSIALVQRTEILSGHAANPADPFQMTAAGAPPKKVVPEIGGEVAAKSQPYAYFVIYPDKANTTKPKIQVELLVNKQLLAKQVAELPPPGPDGAIPMVVGTVARPGSCELRVTALQGDRSSTQSLTYQVKQ